MCEDKMICESVQRAMYSNLIAELTYAENEHLAACGTCADLLVIHLLQRKPEIPVPEEWAVSVALQAAETKTGRAHRPTPAYGFATAVAVLMVMALGWSVLAYVDPQRWVLESGLSRVLAGIVTFEIGVIALWLGIRRSAG